jgi:hypothetical protein
MCLRFLEILRIFARGTFILDFAGIFSLSKYFEILEVILFLSLKGAYVFKL